MRVTLDLDIPEGYEATGEYRKPEGDPWLGNNGRVEKLHIPYPKIILRKVVTYREPVMPDDYGRVIEVRDSDFQAWKAATFCGYRSSSKHPFISQWDVYREARIKE